MYDACYIWHIHFWVPFCSLFRLLDDNEMVDIRILWLLMPCFFWYKEMCIVSLSWNGMVWDNKQQVTVRSECLKQKLIQAKLSDRCWIHFGYSLHINILLFLLLYLFNYTLISFMRVLRRIVLELGWEVKLVNGKFRLNCTSSIPFFVKSIRSFCRL